MKKIMVIDDIEQVARGIASALEKEGYNAAVFTNATDAMAMLEVVTDVDLILTDQNMPDVTGMELLKFVKKLGYAIPVILFTGQGDVDTAVNAMKAGACDFICKPFDNQELLIRIKQALENSELSKEVVQLRKRLEKDENFYSIIGKSKKMLEVYSLIEAVANTDATVLICGETGTGKELVARAIHSASDRKGEPFVAVCCTALQQSLLESELFGHEKGAFTGAHATKIGKMELAGKGTFLLDEAGDTSLEIQSKLLRVLQEREFERVGGIKPIKLRARVLASTNRNLEQDVKEGRFREDLYYRLNVIRIVLPPLREREDEVILLANHFLEHYKDRYKKALEGFTPAAIEQMIEYNWPGNVRELKNVIERTVLTSSRKWIDKLEGIARTHKKGVGLPIQGSLSYDKARQISLDDLEKSYMIKYLKEESGRLNMVAERMGVSVRTITRMLQKHGIDKNHYKTKRTGSSAAQPATGEKASA